MIEVYLNPENENIWEETEEKVDVSENVKTAEKLLKVFSGRSPFCDVSLGVLMALRGEVWCTVYFSLYLRHMIVQTHLV